MSHLIKVGCVWGMAFVLAIIAGAMMWPFKYFLNDLFSAKSFVSFVEEWSWNDLFSAWGDFFWQKRTLRGGIGMFFLGFFCGIFHFCFGKFMENIANKR